MTFKTPRKTSPLPAVIAMGVLIVLAIVFISELGAVSGSGDSAPTAESTLTADTYASEVAALLETADAAAGEALITRYGCVACHAGAGADNKLAPAFDGIGSRAGIRRPPLPAEAYIYESIVHPTAFEVEGYSGNMPVIYDSLIPDEDLGSLIAYLLTLTGK